MFLKIHFDNKVKKVSLGSELAQFEAFTALVSRIADAPFSDLSVHFVDGEDDRLELKDGLDLEYFLNCPSDGKYKSVFVEKSIKFEDSRMSVEAPVEAPMAEEPKLQPINPEARPFRALPHYRGLDEFVSHFDEALNLKSEPQAEAKAERKNVHYHVTCDVCQKTNLVGKRYKCLVCKNFDICEECEAKEAHADHPMIRCNKQENTWAMEKVAKKYRKCLRKIDRKNKIEKRLKESSELFKHTNLRETLNKTLVPVFNKAMEFLGNMAVPKAQPQAKSAPQEAQEQEKVRNEKRELLRFMYENAEQEVIEELVRRFDSLNLSEFLEEIERNNKILDGRF